MLIVIISLLFGQEKNIVFNLLLRRNFLAATNPLITAVFQSWFSNFQTHRRMMFLSDFDDDDDESVWPTTASKTITIPSTVIAWNRRTIPDAAEACAVIFQPGSTIRELSAQAFRIFTSVQSICVPASVEFIRSYCFSPSFDQSAPSRLETVTFEPRSKLRTIQSHAFDSCHLLTQICIPAATGGVDGLTFANCGIRTITVEPGNRYVHVSGGFLMDIKDLYAVRYFAMGTVVTISDKIESLGPGAFTCTAVRTVLFGQASRLLSIEAHVFAECVSLQAICIPASVNCIGAHAFEGCERLPDVGFCPNSQLIQMRENAFRNCLALKHISIPPSVETIGRCCFLTCASLTTVNLAVHANLRTLEQGAFSGCLALQSLFIPASVETIGINCFRDCLSLSTLTFAPASHLNALSDLPIEWAGTREIPDSVEVLKFSIVVDKFSTYTLNFGHESRLRTVHALGEGLILNPSSCRVFLQVSTRSLKAFREDKEFEKDRWFF
jgi:hypothetical protein